MRAQFKPGDEVTNLEGDWKYLVVGVQENGKLIVAAIANLRFHIRFALATAMRFRDVEPETVRRMT